MDDHGATATRTPPVHDLPDATLSGDSGLRWANLLATYIAAVDSGTVAAPEDEDAVLAASLDGSHAGGCG
ncbi:hypothetical protein GKQ77_03640 [Streptomyces sp. BG9H]|uniref:Uncharacterized protein n=1 Tax=Streptomyces anatolicus TaxID=2675858 RepID=A0ABS6YGY0_9ACTN|nr:hypothetical protein [Streptomyces anatolicus]MBW5420663.1 hypothetical protein [Streptomyces anatolicus]